MCRRLLPPLVLFALALALVPASPAAVATPRPRIVGGQPAPTGAFQAMAALVVPGFQHDIDGMFCGGTVIAPYAILTAAHCIKQQDPGPPATTRTLTPADFVVVTGTNDLSGNGGHLAVRAVAVHPQFLQTDAVLQNDIAVVLLRAPTTSPPATRSTTTPTSGNATVFGWGAQQADATGFFAPLQTATLAIQPPGDCGAAFPTAICAGLTSPNVCVGDSGGPLVVSTPSGPRLAGVTSGILSPVGQPTTCGVDSSGFTDVALFQTWVDGNLKPTISTPTMSVLPGGTLRVAWRFVPGGAAPSALVFTSNDPVHPHAAPAGATSLDITGLPAFTPLTVSVRVQNAWGMSQAPVPGTVTLAGAPGITGAAIANGAAGAQVVTNGAATKVTAQYGLDTVHLTTSPAVTLAASAAAQKVSIPLVGLKPASTYRVRLVAVSTGGTAISGWLTLTTPAVKPVARAKPKLRGTARVGKTLRCTAGSWTAAPTPVFSYRWRIGTKVSARSTTAKLKLTTAMAGKKVACVVTARNVAGRVTARSTAVTVRRR